jgi:hypothetical protein
MFVAVPTTVIDCAFSMFSNPTDTDHSICLAIEWNRLRDKRKCFMRGARGATSLHNESQ